MRNFHYVDEFGDETDDYYMEIRQSDLRRRIRNRGIAMFLVGATTMFSFLWMIGWFFEL